MTKRLRPNLLSRGGNTYRLASSIACVLMIGLGSDARARAQEPAGPQAVSSERLQSAISKLGDLDYPTRADAARLVRRVPGAQAVPALLGAVSGHADGYVRYRALVLLTGFHDPRTKDAMRQSLKSPNDRLRTVAYGYFALEPDRGQTEDLVAALNREQAEFVRPALVRALAAAAPGDPRGRQALVREVGRGEDFFRSTVIEALGDYRATYAFDALNSVAKLDGPLLDDTALALGKLGDKRALETLAGLQRTAPRAAQPFVAGAICLLGINCDSHQNYLIETLKFADQNIGFQELLRGAAGALSALGVTGRPGAAEALLDVGIPSRDPTRSPVALALATIALRNTPHMLSLLEKHPRQSEAVALVAEGFDMLDEDLEKERFFALVRRTYWDSKEGSAARALMQTLIGKLDF